LSEDDDHQQSQHHGQHNFDSTRDSNGDSSSSPSHQHYHHECNPACGNDSSCSCSSSGIYSYIVCAKKTLQENKTFGPFKGEVISKNNCTITSDSSNLSNSNNNTNNLIAINGESDVHHECDDETEHLHERDSKKDKMSQSRDSKVNCSSSSSSIRKTVVQLKDEEASWLKILRCASSDSEANASIKVTAGNIDHAIYYKRMRDNCIAS
jgi:hypothetical protein